MITSKYQSEVKSVTFVVTNPAKSRVAALFDNNVVSAKVDASSTFVCPVGSLLVDRTVLIPASERYFKNRFTLFAFYCLPCPLEHYSLNQSTITIFDKRNVGKCQKCPPGSKCQSGVIKARDGFWGHFNNKTKLIQFVPLMAGYGCGGKQCRSYCSCATNRRGTLCGLCDNGFSESMLSAKCIANKDCKVFEFWIIAFLLVGIYVMFFLYKNEIISFIYKRLVLSHLPSSIYGGKQSLQEGRISTDQYVKYDAIAACDSGKENEDEECPMDKSDSNCFAGFLKVVFYFYQIEPLLRSYENDTESKVIQDMKTTITSFFNFHFLAGSGSMSCSSHNATPLTKVVTRSTLLLIMLLMLGCADLLSMFFHHVKKPCLRDIDVQRSYRVLFTERVLLALFEAALLSYALIAKTVFSLLTCIRVGDANVLYMQGSEQCYQSWQYAMMVLGATWVIPFCLLIILLPMSIHRKFIGKWSIFIACLLPLPYVLNLIFKCRTYKQTLDEEHVAADNVCAAILKNLTGCFKCISKHSLQWEGIYLIRRLILISISTFVKDLIYKSYFILLIQILILLHHVNVKPFRSKMLNVLETISLTILIMISAMATFGNFAYTHGIHEEGNHLMLLKVFSWIRVVIVLLLPALACVFIVFFLLAFLLSSTIGIFAKCLTKFVAVSYGPSS